MKKDTEKTLAETNRSNDNAPKLIFQNPKLVFLFIFHDPSLELSKLFTSRTGWTVKEVKEHLGHYSERYISVAQPCFEIKQSDIEIRKLDLESLERLAKHSRQTGLIYNRLLKEKPDVLNDVMLKSIIRAYYGGICAIRLIMSLDSELNTDHLVALVNGLYDSRLELCSEIDRKLTLGSLVQNIRNELSTKLGDGAIAGTNYLERYSMIVPSRIVPTFESKTKYFSPEYEREIYAVAIRRIQDWGRMDIELARKIQIDIGFFESDIVMINFHNALLYLPSGMELEIYIRAIEATKSMNVVLQYYNLLVFEVLQKIKYLKASRDVFEAETTEIETIAVESLEALENLRMLTQPASFRVQRLVAKTSQVFGTKELVTSLHEKLDTLDTFLASRYNILTQRGLERIATLLQKLVLLKSMDEDLPPEELPSIKRQLLERVHEDVENIVKTLDNERIRLDKEASRTIVKIKGKRGETEADKLRNKAKTLSNKIDEYQKKTWPRFRDKVNAVQTFRELEEAEAELKRQIPELQ